MMRKKIHLLCVQACLLFSLSASTAVSYADTPFIGEVRWFAGNFAPRDWAECDGQILPIASHTALFSLLGTTYGGDGRTTFALPEMRGRGMVHEGRGTGLTIRSLGARSGTQSETLIESQLPLHDHNLRADSSGGDSVLPDGRVVSKVGRLRVFSDTADSDMGATSIAPAGDGRSHNNMQPSIGLTCIIALQGIYPVRD